MDPMRYEGLTRDEARTQLAKEMEAARSRSAITIRTLFQSAEALRTLGRPDLAGELEIIAGETLQALTQDFPQLQEAMSKLIDAL